MKTLGLDIGGANVKAADNDGTTRTQPFAIWNDPHGLTEVLRQILRRFDAVDRLAVTMTAELADCFSTKREGVDHILDSVEAVAGDLPVLVWQTGGEFVSATVARDIPLLVAAANWHALAMWCGRIAPRGPALMVDIGTTTTDIIPLFDGVPIPHGLTDVERLCSGELVYTGVERTPICAVTPAVTLAGQTGAGQTCRVAAELFATMRDVHLVLQKLPEAPNDTATANGRPPTRAESLGRLARSLCCDPTEINETQLIKIAEEVAAAQKQTILAAIKTVLSRQSEPCEHVILSGAGEFLARETIGQHEQLQLAEMTSLSATLSADVAESACAFALARLAAES